MPSRGNHNDLTDRLQAYIAAAGDPGRVVGGVAIIPEGHAGLAHSFKLKRPGDDLRDYVLKLAPAGVPRRGSTDIYRQVPILRLLRANEFPVPQVPWADAGEEWLGAPFIVMERLPGQTFLPWQPLPAIAARSDLTDMWLQAAEMLGHLHSACSAAQLATWEAPTTLGAELDRWQRLVRHSPDPAVRGTAARLAAALQRALPRDDTIGLIHGDYQPGNILYVDGAASALIDWDLAAVGPQGMDVGWLLMMSDGRAWASEWQPIGSPTAAAIIEAYAAGGGRATTRLGWHQAFACFRMAVITGLNLKLHRDGRRVDAMWETFASSAATLLARGLALIDGC